MAVFVDEGPPLVLCELAILRIGAAFCPIDKAYPTARLQFLLKDCKANAAFVYRAHIPLLSSVLQSADVGMCVVDDALEQERDTNLEDRIRTEGVHSSDDVCHIIYTSGSTGEPKGVVVEHRSLIAYMKQKVLVHNVTRDSRVLLVSAHTWDPSLGDIFSTLSVVWTKMNCHVGICRVLLYVLLREEKLCKT